MEYMDSGLKHSHASTTDWPCQASISNWMMKGKNCRGQISRVLANGPGDLGSIPGRIIPKNEKMVLDAALPNTQYYKVGIEGKIEQSRERSSALP